MTNILIGSNLLSIVWHNSILWLVFINPFLPDLLASVDFIGDLLEEECVLVGKLVLGKGLQVQPLLLLHPVEWFGSVIDTTTGFEKETNIAIG